jgi:osmotically-inducible protein OsmY
MEDRNRNTNDQYNRNWDRDRNWNDRQNESNRDYNSESGYGNVYNRDQDMRNDYGNSGYSGNRGSQYGNRGWENESRTNQQHTGSNQYNTGYGSQQHDNSWNRQGGSSRAGMYGSDFGMQGARYGGSGGGMSSGQDHGNVFNSRNEGWSGSSGSSGYFPGQDRNYSGQDRSSFQDRGSFTENRYGGDTRNYGNMNQGGYDRDWWDRTRDEVSSWFGDSDAERRRRADRQQSGQHRGKGPKGYSRSDDRVQEDVCSRLADDDYLDATNIEVKVENGEVVLTGTVNDREQKRRAEDLVERISGVRDVENRIKVNRDSTLGSSSTSSTRW